MTQRIPVAATQPDPLILEGLRRVIEDQIGPRRTGAIYQNSDGAFEVLALVLNPEEARALLRRRSAQWAVIVRDVLRPDSQPVAVGSVWTTSDQLVREAATRVSAGRKCASCRGKGGRMVDTSSDGVTRQTWQTCTACGGSGEAG
ncbi:hypothetical protein AB8O64_36815 (plasmid) [Streptomyces sp. QH1-20]|uniref:hypothetical protein n=1 Tax=Streptomyces sp. QH1-20 TaxID=3240934 RepID=UPI0035129BF1